MKKLIMPAAVMALLAGCASNPWPYYEGAIRCHMDKKGEQCNKQYEEAIKIDPKLQGVHASYGVHLLLNGKPSEAEKEFALERANYPQFAEKGLAALAGNKIQADGSNSTDATSTVKSVTDTTAKH
ncbi:MAG: hypothetical protein RL318_270 [Fibrobacterota bacterium]